MMVSEYSLHPAEELKLKEHQHRYAGYIRLLLQATNLKNDTIADKFLKIANGSTAEDLFHDMMARRKRSKL